MKPFVVVILAAFLLAGFPAPGSGQSGEKYPVKPIRVIFRWSPAPGAMCSAARWSKRCPRFWTAHDRGEQRARPGPSA